MKTTILSLAVFSMLGISLLATNMYAQQIATPNDQTATVAPTKIPGIDARQKMQRARIREGVKSGELTKHEVHRLRRGEARIHRHERHLKAQNGGTLNPTQKAKINHKLNRESRRIARQKHDAQTR